MIFLSENVFILSSPYPRTEVQLGEGVEMDGRFLSAH